VKIIEGFEPAKAALSREAPKEVFGDDREQAVRQIIDDVRRRGDTALFGYTKKFDGAELTSLEVNKKQVKDAYREVSKELISALKLAARRINSFHLKQKRRIWRLASPSSGQLIRPLERVGVYAPGGTAPYPSTVLMTAIPARVAGVSEIILATPPRANGVISAPTLVAADIAGVDRIFSVGGAQAIAALAFGTETIPRVDKICGPGNIYITLAKKLLYGVVGIDSLAGPSEVLIIADETANPSYCAADLLAQAEHDPLATAIMITTSKRLAEGVNQEIERQLKDLGRQAIASESIKNRGLIALVASVNEAIELANLYAPEHLYLMTKGAENYVERIANAGCISIGESSTVALSDYVFGPSHVLPTGATARFASPLNILDFVKLINLVNVDKASLLKLGKAAAAIARAEGLEAHARAIERRLERNY
jgi:histidinol dehydrogenase